jgi:hypothetical protein
MKPISARSLRLLNLVGFGAVVLMFLTAPSPGRRGRGYVRDRIRHGGRATVSILRRTWTGVGNHVHRLRATAHSFFWRRYAARR